MLDETRARSIEIDCRAVICFPLAPSEEGSDLDRRICLITDLDINYVSEGSVQTEIRYVTLQLAGW
jgi:hypothetical protein